MDQETRAQLKQILLSRKWTLRAQTTAGKREKPSGVDGLKEQGMSALSAGIDDCGMPVLHPLMHVYAGARLSRLRYPELLFPEEICYPDPFCLLISGLLLK